MIERVLRNIGLTEYETKVYTALLNIGESTTGKILAEAGMHSGKIYEILESLKKKGLVSEVTKNKVKYFSPADPSRVKDYLDEKKRNLEHQQDEFSHIMPILMKKISQVKSPVNIEVFTGFNGLKTAFEKEVKRYKKTSVLRVLGVLGYAEYKKNVSQKYLDFFTFYMKPRREAIGFKMYKINDPKARKDRHLHEKNAEIKYLSYNSCMSINVLDDLSILGIFSKEPIFITIESNDVATSFIESFDAVWKIAKE